MTQTTTLHLWRRSGLHQKAACDKRELKLKIVAVLLGAFFSSLYADEVALRQLQPVMPLKVCHTYAGVKAQVEKSKSLARVNANANAYEAAIVNECELLQGNR